MRDRGGDRRCQPEAAFRNAPDGASLRWSSPKPGALVIDNPASSLTRVRGVTPGRQDFDVELLDAGGVRIASMKLKLSVPQCVTIAKDAVLFGQALSDAQLAGHENDIVADMKLTVEHLLAKANVRVFWHVGGLNEPVSAHVPAANVIAVTLKKADPGGDAGRTTSASNTDNETISLFPGTFSLPNATDVDTETVTVSWRARRKRPGGAPRSFRWCQVKPRMPGAFRSCLRHHWYGSRLTPRRKLMFLGCPPS